MINNTNNTKLGQHVTPRRAVLKWMGQVVSGASLAAIALGLADPENAFAMPGCKQCPTGCIVSTCIGNPPCSENLRYYVVAGNYIGGCAGPNGCPTTCYYDGCRAGCNCCA